MANNRFIRDLTPLRNTGEQLRLHILWLLMIRVMLFTLLIAITVVLQAKGRNIILPPPAITLAFLAVVFIYSIGSAALLQHKIHHLPRFALIQLISDGIFAALLVAGTGCSQSIFTPIFIFPVIAGGLNMMSRAGGLVAAAVASILYGALLVSEYFGYIPNFYARTIYSPPSHFLDLTNVYAVYGITFFTIGLLSNILSGRLRKTEEALSSTFVRFDRLNQLYKQIFDDISTGIITIDGRNRVTSCNQALERISGYSADDLAGLPFDSFFPAIILSETDPSKQVADLQRKNASSTRIRYTYAHLNLPPDPQLNDPGDAQCKVVTIQDISHLEKMEAQIRGAEKMAAIGELSAAIAHDFRNPITAISGSAQLLQKIHAGPYLEESKAANQHLTEIILRESLRMEKTITDFLQFARPVPLSLEWFNLKALIEEILRQGNKFCNENSKIVTAMPDTLDCWADRQLVQNILIHLLENSCAALSNRPSSWPVVVQAEEVDNVIRLTVRDKGIGIPQILREQVFQPFFSTRKNSSGLGLSIVRQLTEQHGGTVRLLEPEEGEGCVVEVRLPLPPLEDHT